MALFSLSLCKNNLEEIQTSEETKGDDLRKPLSLPKILDGKFYTNIQPHPRTPGGIQAQCTTCFGTISGTTKSTGNFLSHIKRRHKEILVSCQLYCSAKSLSCFTQDGKLNFGVNFRMPNIPHETAKIMAIEEEFPTTTTTVQHRIHSPSSAVSNSAQMPLSQLFHRNDCMPTNVTLGTASTPTTQNIVVASIATNSLSANGMYKPPQHI